MPMQSSSIIFCAGPCFSYFSTKTNLTVTSLIFLWRYKKNGNLYNEGIQSFKGIFPKESICFEQLVLDILLPIKLRIKSESY